MTCIKPVAGALVLGTVLSLRHDGEDDPHIEERRPVQSEIVFRFLTATTTPAPTSRTAEEVGKV